MQISYINLTPAKKEILSLLNLLLLLFLFMFQEKTLKPIKIPKTSRHNSSKSRKQGSCGLFAEFHRSIHIRRCYLEERQICTSNHVFGRAIWDKLHECLFENFQIFKFFENHKGDLFQKSPEPNM